MYHFCIYTCVYIFLHHIPLLFYIMQNCQLIYACNALGTALRVEKSKEQHFNKIMSLFGRSVKMEYHY
jgi:hypothetical protein